MSKEDKENIPIAHIYMANFLYQVVNIHLQFWVSSSITRNKPYPAGTQIFYIESITTALALCF